MDGKAAVDESIVQKVPELASKTTFLYVGFYAGNLRYPNFVPSLLASSRKWVWVREVGESTLVPMAGDEGVNVGAVVERVLERKEATLGRCVGLVAEWMECGEVLRLWGRVVGEVKGR